MTKVNQGCKAYGTHEENAQVTAEELAFHYLTKAGYKILLRNYENALGSADLIAKEGGALVFLSINKGRSASETVKRVARYYVKRYVISNVRMRFDAVRVEFHEGAEPVVSVSRGSEIK